MRGIDVFLFTHVCILGCNGRGLASLRLRESVGGMCVFLTGGGAGGILGRREVNLHFFQSPLDHWMLFQLWIVSHVLKQQIQICILLLIKTFDEFLFIFIELKHP